jgi:glycosyltransferase involved in cell wall biosynthesis
MATNDIKRILVFSTAYYPFVGGAEVAIKEITDRIGNSTGGFQFDLITARFKKDLPKMEKIGNVTVYRVGVGSSLFDKLLLPFAGAVLAWRLNKNQNYFCFWAMMATFSSGAGYICNIARRLSGKKKIPMVLTLQEGDSESHLKYKWAGLIALSWKMALWNTDYLTAISNFLLHRAKKNGYKGECKLVPNGVDLKLFSQTINEDVKNNIKSRLNKKIDDIFLVTSGRLTHKNAVDDIISALPHLAKNITLIIIGKGDLGPKLQKRARDLDVGLRVKFLGFMPYEDLPKYLSVCDIFVRPSRSEGFGNSFIEAMAAGLPVIATPVGGIPDFIDDKETGIFCSPDNPQSLARAVTLVLQDSNLRERIIKQAVSRVRERYGWDTVSSEMKSVFDLLR